MSNCSQLRLQAQWLDPRELPSTPNLRRWAQQFEMSSLRKHNKQLLADKKPETMVIDELELDAGHKSAHYGHESTA